jgi:hypothetical protein
MNEDTVKWGLGLVIEGSAALIYFIYGPQFVSILLVLLGVIIILWGIFGIKSKSKKKENTEEEEPKLVEETIFDDFVTVPKGDHKKLKYIFNEGDLITGNVSESVGDPFNFYIMDKNLYSKYRSGHEPEYFDGDEDLTSYPIDFTVPHNGIWYFVFDTYMKRIKREIEVYLRRSFYKK